MRVLDLFCGKWGIGGAFGARGHSVVGVDLKKYCEPPANCELWIWDVLNLTSDYVKRFHFAWASSPCEEFSVHGMKHFFTKPKYPEMGIRLFNHTRSIFEQSGVPYVMENVRSAQQFVGAAVHHSGPYFLWGNAVPPLIPARVRNKLITLAGGEYARAKKHGNIREVRNSKPYKNASDAAVIPAELANCVADYAERICERGSTAAIYEAQK